MLMAARPSFILSIQYTSQCFPKFHIYVTAKSYKMNYMLLTTNKLQLLTLSFFFSHPPVPCAPTNVSATLVCLNHSALVSWVGSPSATRYNVTMTGQDGHAHHCSTNSTSCQIPHIHCGETYGIVVTPFSDTCAGNPSAIYSFKAGAERF